MNVALAVCGLYEIMGERNSENFVKDRPRPNIEYRPPVRELPRQLAQTGPRTRAKACPWSLPDALEEQRGLVGIPPLWRRIPHNYRVPPGARKTALNERRQKDGGAPYEGLSPLLFVYNLSCFTHGCSTGWVSGVLGSEALAGGAWLAALPCLVALPAAPFFAVLADSRGRKAGAFCISLSFIISWSLAAWCGPRGVWTARVAAGAGGAGAMALAPLYCAEIAPRARGLAAMPALACSCGILFAYCAGVLLSPHALSLSMAVAPAVLLLSLLWLPETPLYLINAGKIQEAAKVMCWFDGSDFREDLTDVIEQQEVRIRTSECVGRRQHLRRHDSDTFQPMLKRSSGLDSNCDRKEQMSLPRGAWGAWDAGCVLCGLALVLGAALATLTVDKLGRKTLLLWSCSGIACCLAILGVYCDPHLRMHSWYQQPLYKKIIKEKMREIEHDRESYRDIYNESITNISGDPIGLFRISLENVTPTSWSVKYEQSAGENEDIWAPITLLSIVLFLYNIGLGSVPYVLISELFSVHVRSLASSFLISCTWLSNFLLLRYFGSLASYLGLHAVYYLCASSTLLGTAGLYVLLPETKGKSQGQIEEELNQPLLNWRKRKQRNPR
ncbi:Solute carrier family 2, facilitated glucose transporter member 8 [Papilio xuthus]|uniref:Solute carrier family 2, facilitated glucose transporter member 8 n=1 Tax=Papilio xuthus TaxID=66420 RepID=A0A194Q5F2_PAPXU|nr:Solute carrier family 2, facilitated glucose transporter member 8 [Papilio xuthus]